jgi:hypothetical protein
MFWFVVDDDFVAAAPDVVHHGRFFIELASQLIEVGHFQPRT